jgi:type III restriction enzyme
VDTSSGKDVDALGITLPRLSRRFNREYKDLDALDPDTLGTPRLPIKPFTAEETRAIVFKTMLDGEVHHTVELDGAGASDYRSVVGFFARELLRDLRLVGGYDVLYGKVKAFIQRALFEGPPVDLESPLILRNLSEPEAGKVLLDGFRKAINALTIQDAGSTRIEDRIRLRDTRPFRTEPRKYYEPRKSVFSKIVGEPGAEGFELRFARFLDDAPDVVAFAKNYLAVGFRLDYVRADGDLSNYVPDFIVRTVDGTIWIVETKGREEIDLPGKMRRLAQWCADATAASAAEGGPAYRFVYVDEEGFGKAEPRTFESLAKAFTEYQTASQPRRPGSAKGAVVVADDFDRTPSDFDPYT